jgi:hypothetical protein
MVIANRESILGLRMHDTAAAIFTTNASGIRWAQGPKGNRGRRIDLDTFQNDATGGS